VQAAVSIPHTGDRRVEEAVQVQRVDVTTRCHVSGEGEVGIEDRQYLLRSRIIWRYDQV
jgi:hypothetical protein